MQRFIGASSTNLSGWLQRQWQCFTPWQVLLLPLALVFALLSGLRRMFYRLGWLRSTKLPVPVVVVGNITVGGTGKTPLVIWLAEFLRDHGYRPGIVSRGYGGQTQQPMAVTLSSSPIVVGDEPVLLAHRAKCPVWVGAERAKVALALLAAEPSCDIIISDDGLQHYALKRAVEIVVVDGERRFGNGFLLPAGPLREPRSRLKTVDAVVINGDAGAGEFSMKLLATGFRHLVDGAAATAADFAGKRLHALAGIGHPKRFFAQLRRLGLVATEHAFPDHYAYSRRDLQFDDADAILMTEKDAVKCADFASDNCWALVVNAEVDAALEDLLLEKLRKLHGR